MIGNAGPRPGWDLLTTVIMIGPSGCGKSRKAERLREDCRAHGVPVADIFSADRLFTDSISGEYRFDASRLGEAHDRCFNDYRFFASAFPNGMAIVDNTNLTREEIAPYLMLGRQWGKVILAVWGGGVSESELAARNVHKVPLATIQRQLELWSLLTFPAYWTCDKRVSIERWGE